MCTRDSAATIGINDFFLLFKKKWHMPCQCGGEQGCYKIAQSVWKFLKIFPPLITVEFLLLILLFDLKTVSYEFGWATTTLLPEQAAACSNDRHFQKSLHSVTVPADLTTTDQRKLMLCSIWSNAACVSQRAVLFQELHPSIIETSQTKEFKYDHHIAIRESKVIYHLLALQGTSITEKCVPNK